MEGMLLYVHYNWSGKDIKRITDLNEYYRDVANRHFSELRNKACDALNAKLDEWNKEFDEKYPDIVEDNYDPNSKYMKYICKKQNEVLSSISVFITFTPANDEAKKFCK